MPKYVFQIQYGVWMKKSILKFFNKLLFPTLSIWIVQLPSMLMIQLIKYDENTLSHRQWSCQPFRVYRV